jgi:hypothetical protein
MAENRSDGTQKGNGYFGVLKRPDGNVSTEISIGVGLNGKETQIPLIVPTLNKAELNYLLANDPDSDDFMSRMPSTIVDKAVDHAVGRLKSGQSPFSREDESYDMPNE